MTKILIAISVFLFVCSPFANAEQVYYCASELTTGFNKDKKTGEWERREFKVQRYTIKFNDEYTKLDGLDEFGSWKCKKVYGGHEEFKNVRICVPDLQSGMLFQFDYLTLRFLYSQTPVSGYLGNSHNADTNGIIAGTCQKF